jgi:uncharacterized protein involved in exopolysaccharide biosynthesis
VWEACQALIIRNEAATNDEAPGKFVGTDEMKTVQETILELARSRGVLSAALKDVGPPAEYRKPLSSWPTAEDIAGLRDHLELSAPKGAEFGSTEIFYLKVRDRDRHRASALATAVSGHLESAFQHVRNAKAQSMIHELTKAARLAGEDLKESTARLAAIESRAGSDLAELRILHDSNSGESSLRRAMTEIHGELRQAMAEKSTSEGLLSLLQTGRDDPNALLGVPARMLEAQPALRELREGLIAAQLRTANLQGRMSDEHPLVLAALESERRIRADLHEELASAICGVEADLRLTRDRIRLLEQQLEATCRKLAALAELRASYSNQVAETANRVQLLQRAEEKLAEARTTQATADAASLIARIDVPDTGTDPIGPSRAMLVLMGIAAGLAAAAGFALLTVPPSQPALSQEVAAAPEVLNARFPSTNGRSKTPAPATGQVSLKQALLKLSPANRGWRSS